jgi:hypothetical protein
MTRTELLAELEAAALDYAKKWDAYVAAYDRDPNRHRSYPELTPETRTAIDVANEAAEKLKKAARALRCFDLEHAAVAKAG